MDTEVSYRCKFTNKSSNSTLKLQTQKYLMDIKVSYGYKTNLKMQIYFNFESKAADAKLPNGYKSILWLQKYLTDTKVS